MGMRGMDSAGGPGMKLRTGEAALIALWLLGMAMVLYGCTPTATHIDLDAPELHYDEVRVLLSPQGDSATVELVVGEEVVHRYAAPRTYIGYAFDGGE